MTCRQPQLVDVVERVVKRGQTMYVEGPIEVRDYVDKDGVERKSWAVKLMNNSSFRILKWPQGQEGADSPLGGGYGGASAGGGGATSSSSKAANRNDRNVFGSDGGQVYE